MTFKKYHGNIAPSVLVTSSRGNGNHKPNSVAAKLESLQSEKKGRKIYWWLKGWGEASCRQMACLGTRYISPLPGHRYLSQEIKAQGEVQKWQLKIRGALPRLWEAVDVWEGVDMPRDTRLHATRSEWIFQREKCTFEHKWELVSVFRDETTDPLPML